MHSLRQRLPASPIRTIAGLGANGPNAQYLWGMMIFALGFLIRIAYIFKYRFDNDEPQHLHVAWGWANGLAQYRDVFDNHAPLFHMLASLPVRLFGDRADLLILMRMAMLPLYAITLWSIYHIGTNLFSRRIGFWSAIIAGLYPSFFLTTVEFRTDDLWAMFYILSIAVIVSSSFSAARGLLAGILLGATISISMKTSVLLICMGAAGAATPVLSASARSQFLCTKRSLRFLAMLVTGFLIVPLAIVVWFYSHGMLHDLYYGAIEHNMVSGMGEPNLRKKISFAVAAISLLFIARTDLAKGVLFRPVNPLCTFLFLLTGWYFVTIRYLWPLVTRQDFLPSTPIFILLLLPLADRSLAYCRRSWRWASPACLLTLGGIELLAIAAPLPSMLHSHHVSNHIARWKAVLDLTKPDEFVMDQKGGLVFRKRAYYWGLEIVTRNRIRQHLILDTLNDKLIETRTCVIDPHLDQYPKESRKFILSNYINTRWLFVPGKELAHTPANPDRKAVFDILIPADYIVLNSNQQAKGLLDGKKCDTSDALKNGIFLESGRHEYLFAPGEDKVDLVWARAIEHGYFPRRPKPLTKIEVEIVKGSIHDLRTLNGDSP